MTKIKANQLEIREILNDPAAQASETWKGTLRIATQAEVNGGSPYDNTLTITPETLAGSNFNTNWLTANNGDDFVTAPIATGVNSIVIGHGANATWLGAIAIGTDASASANYEGIAIGVRASADYHGVALGWQAKTTGNANVSVGTDTKAYGARSIAIGAITEASATSNSSIAMGYRAKATLNSQIVIGHHLTDVDVATDVAYSVKLGYAVDGNINKNILHLHSKGKLELVGDEAQFIFPNYSPTGSPATALPSTTNQGGTIYDFDTKTLKFYNGTTWTELNSQNWLSANSGDDFITAPTASFANAIALGHNSQALASAAIAVGSNVTASINSVSLGINSDTLGSSSIAIGNGAQSGTGGEGATIAIGLNSSSVLGSQVSIGNGVDGTTVTPTDVQFSTKIGYGETGTPDGNKNMLHLFSKGKLELYGESAQFIMPNYAAGSPSVLPSTATEGGVIYDSTLQGLKLYDGAAWQDVGGGGGASNNWIEANDGSNFATAPDSGFDGSNNIAIGHAAIISTSAAIVGAIAIGHTADVGATRGIAIGQYADASDKQGVSIGFDTEAGYDAIAIGNTAKAIGSNSQIAIGKSATANVTRSIAIGHNAAISTGSSSAIALGELAHGYGIRAVAVGRDAAAAGYQSGAFGSFAEVDLDFQFAGGTNIASTSVTTDVAYSAKLGYGTANTNKNLLHLHSKGKLELYGESAQFIMPNYAAGSPSVLPSTATEGGVIYDSTLQGLKLYDGAAWQDVGGGAGGGLQDVVDDASPQLGGHLDVNGYQINTPNLATDANTGQISIRPGTANWVGAGSTSGGNLFAAAGYATSDNHGGATTIAAGKALGTGAGGSLTISGGATQFGTIAGPITVRGGYATAGNGAIANFRGGASYGGFLGGSAIIEGGETFGGGGATTRGGSVIIQGGRAYAGSPIGTNGNVILTAGAGAGNPGSIQLHPAGDHTGPSSLQFWNYTDAVHTTGMYVALEAPAGSPAVWSDYTLVLPNADGAAGDVIETDGNGILSFADLKHLSINTQIGTPYTLVLTDDNKLVLMDNGSPNELIIPTNASVAFPIGTQILVEQEGAGVTTITSLGSPPDVTIHSAGNFFDTASQYTTISLIKKATDTWLIVGDLA